MRSQQSVRARGVVRQAQRHLGFFGLAASVALLDQLTKWLIRERLAYGQSWPSDDWLVKSTHGSNTGAAFGILQDQGAMLTVAGLVAIAAIIFYYVYAPLQTGFSRIGLGLIVGGAAGNLIDRLLRGEVTDFIDFPRYPNFNLADSSIVVGMLIIAAASLLSPGSTKQAASETHTMDSLRS